MVSGICTFFGVAAGFTLVGQLVYGGKTKDVSPARSTPKLTEIQIKMNNAAIARLKREQGLD